MTSIEIKEIGRVDEDTYSAIQYTILADGVAAGRINVQVDENFAYCADICVWEEKRNAGIGTAALKALVSEYGSVIIAPDNEDARRLYDRLGSEWVNEEAGYIDQGYGVYEL